MLIYGWGNTHTGLMAAGIEGAIVFSHTHLHMREGVYSDTFEHTKGRTEIML